MQINTALHAYSDQVESFYSNGRSITPFAIGMQKEVSEATIVNKPASLREYLSRYDLKNITPNQLAALASRLFEAGEISDEAAGEFIVVGLDQAKDQPFDAISHFENKFSFVKRISSNYSTLGSAGKIYSDTLHTLYNLDDFIRGSRSSLSIDTKA